MPSWPLCCPVMTLTQRPVQGGGPEYIEPVWMVGSSIQVIYGVRLTECSGNMERKMFKLNFTATVISDEHRMGAHQAHQNLIKIKGCVPEVSQGQHDWAWLELDSPNSNETQVTLILMWVKYLSHLSMHILKCLTPVTQLDSLDFFEFEFTSSAYKIGVKWSQESKHFYFESMKYSVFHVFIFF